MSVLDDIRPNVRHILDDSIVQRSRRAHRARHRHRSEHELARLGGFPGAAPAIAVDAHVDPPVGAKCHRVLRPIARRGDFVVHRLDTHQLPRRTGETRRRRLSARLRARHRNKRSGYYRQNPREMAVHCRSLRARRGAPRSATCRGLTTWFVAIGQRSAPVFSTEAAIRPVKPARLHSSCEGRPRGSESGGRSHIRSRGLT